ncbi:hypothetical protein O6H91_20G055000 [Diphasiastrum complanatum]|uniref:Uncharacterized protein n=4 Tax=Diphasiastrum complanatum TaxID=34168 RepID=A0ACC2AQE7_DIPCM|nr:hypothetical protein O6H91_20G055000 [Diphasiastrum complanatum]
MTKGRKIGREFHLRTGSSARIIVGIKNLREGQSILNWLFRKAVFEKGDTILLLHVDTTDPKPSNIGPRLADVLHCNEASDEKSEVIFRYLSAKVSNLVNKYNVPEVNILAKIVRTCYIGTALVSEAQRIKATVIVLGSSRLFAFVKSVNSIREQCIKDLPACCSIIVLRRGEKLLIKAGAAPAARDYGTLRVRTQSEKEEIGMEADVDDLQDLRDLQNFPDQYNQDDNFPSHLTSSLNRTAKLYDIESPSTDSEMQFGYLSSFTSNGSSATSLDSPTSVLKCPGDYGASETKFYPEKPYLETMRPRGNFSFRPNNIIDWLQSGPNLCLTSRFSEQHHKDTPNAFTECEATEEMPKSSALEINMGTECEARSQELKPLLARIADRTTVSMELFEVGQMLDKYISHYPEDLLEEFSFQELELATKGFAAENLIGSGGTGKVFKGHLPMGKIVAVKRLANTFEIKEEFFTEIGILSKICHKNVVSLIGFCVESEHRMLVYEFLKNGNLQQTLQGNHHNATIPWEVRQQVAFGAAQGLNYLHMCAPRQIIHCDVKSANILLNEDFEAKISDFGYAKLRLQGATELPSSEVIVGTFGYLAPELLVSGYFDEKTDVYSFGVVLLELISGRSSIDSSLPSSTQSLAQWAALLAKTGSTHELVDPKLTDLDLLQLKRMIYTAMQCIRSLPEQRPSMERVMRLLDPEWECTEPLLANYLP